MADPLLGVQAPGLNAPSNICVLTVFTGNLEPIVVDVDHAELGGRIVSPSEGTLRAPAVRRLKVRMN